ncbi:MAG: acyl-ACP--UDP-N-acetylglucosamine O-acyltransferase [Spartobacteria bacterium]|nr:acyl-ACP--UDP-N-acetylglucosamine O-acyltransferase [Spartobacteria bacterium]
MTASVHQSAVVHPDAVLGEGVVIGPYCVVGSQVRLGDHTELVSHVCVDGNTAIGSHCRIYPFASIGLKTQDLKYKGGNPGVIIGDRCEFREYVTVNAATYDGDFTQVGSDCLVMAYAHIAHDCKVGNEVIIANACALAGHIVIEDQVGVGGLVGIHQFVRLGRLSYIGGCTKITQDVPPFMMADGNPVAVRTINQVGMQRRGISADVQRSIKEAFRLLYRKNLTVKAAIEAMQDELPNSDELQYFIQFLKNAARGITR